MKFSGFNTSEKLGIGTDTPVAPLHVMKHLGSGSGQEYIGDVRIGGANTTFGLELKYDQYANTVSTIYHSPAYSNANQLFKLGSGSGNTNQLVLKGNGNVGIGTTAPAKMLDVAGTFGVLNQAYFNSYVDVNGYLHLQGSGSRLYMYGVDNWIQHDGGGFDIFGNNTQLMYWKDDGNVGINTTSPTHPLHIVSTIAQDTANMIAKFTNATGDAGIEISGTNDNIEGVYGGNRSGGTLELRNLSNTANNYSMVKFSNSTDYSFAGMHGVCYVQGGSGVVEGGLEFWVRNTGGYHKSLNLNEDGKLTVSAVSGGNQALFRTNEASASQRAGGGFSSLGHATAASRYARMFLDADGGNFSGADYFTIEKFGGGHDNPGGEVKLLNYSDADMSFWVNTSIRAMTIKEGGNVSIGTSSSGGRLQLHAPSSSTRLKITSTGSGGASDIDIDISGGTYGYPLRVFSGGTNYCRITSTGDFIADKGGFRQSENDSTPNKFYDTHIGGDPDSRPGGMIIFSMSITEGTTTTFFNPSDLDGVWSGMIEMHAKGHNDTNRSSYQQLVFRYSNAFTALQSSNLNLTPTFSYVAGAGAAQGMRVNFAGGGYGQTIDCVFRIMGSHNS